MQSSWFNPMSPCSCSSRNHGWVIPCPAARLSTLLSTVHQLSALSIHLAWPWQHPRAGLVHARAHTHCLSSPCSPPFSKAAIQSEVWPHWGTFCTWYQVIAKSRWVQGQAVAGGQHRRGWWEAPPRPIPDHLLQPCTAKATTFLSSTGSRQAE